MDIWRFRFAGDSVLSVFHGYNYSTVIYILLLTAEYLKAKFNSEQNAVTKLY